MSSDQCILIVPYHDSEEYLQRLLRDWNGRTPVLVVDNSTLPLKKTDDFHYVRTPDNIGFGRAVNIGIQYAARLGYKFGIVSNQDVRIIQLDVNQLIKHCDSNATILVPKVMTYDGSSIKPHILKWYGTSYSRDLASGRLKPTYSIDFCGLCFFCIRLDLSEVPLFDSAFHMYKEDRDLIRRVVDKGGKLLLHTQSIIAHEGSGSRNPRYKLDYHFNRSLIIYSLRYDELLSRNLSTYIIKKAVKSMMGGSLVDGLKILVLVLKSRSLIGLAKSPKRKQSTIEQLQKDKSSSTYK